MNVTYLSVTFVLPDLQACLGGFTGSPHKNTLAAQFRTAPRATVSAMSLPLTRSQGEATTASKKSVIL
jgi:hypothetical protein